MVGGTINSGNVNTGEIQTIRGGGQKCGLWSGTLTAGGNGVVGFNIVNASGGHAQLVSGPGRLNSIQPYVLTSGSPVFFYDAQSITLSGVSVSGQNILATIPSAWQASFASGNTPSVMFAGQPFNVDIPFFSGLCVSCPPAGGTGFTVTYTPDTEPNFG